MNLTIEAIGILRAAVDRIAKHPERFDMGYWAGRHPCGTTLCLAGTICMMDGWTPVFDGSKLGECFEKDEQKMFATEICASVLGLSSEHMRDLFHVGRWPTQFGLEYNGAKTDEARAEALAHRVEFFIKTNGTDRVRKKGTK